MVPCSLGVGYFWSHVPSEGLPCPSTWIPYLPGWDMGPEIPYPQDTVLLNALPWIPYPTEGTWDQRNPTPRRDMGPPGTTKAGGTHPTGMLSCFQCACGFLFNNEEGQLRMKCPDCHKETCFGCKKPVSCDSHLNSNH